MPRPLLMVLAPHRLLSRYTLPTSPSDLMFTACILGVLTLGTALRLYLLGDKAVWWDEGWSIFLARKSPPQIILESAATQHPPLHYLYLHYWIRLVGESEFAARLSSVLFGIATLPVVYKLGAQIGGRATGVGAALFLAVAPFHVHWSQEIRMYSAATFFGALSVLLCLLLLSRPTVPLWVSYITATSAMLYLHYGTAILMVVEGLVFATALRERDGRGRRLRYWMTAQLVTVATLAPWVVLYAGKTSARADSPDMPPLEFASLTFTLLPLGVSAYLDRYLWLAVGFTALALLGLGTLVATEHRARLEARVLPLLGVVVAPGALYLLSLPTSAPYSPRIEERYLLMFLPLYAVGIGAGLAFLARRALILGIIPSIFILLVLGGEINGYYEKRFITYDLRALGQFINAYVQPDDAVVLNPDRDWPVYAYYLGRDVHFFTIPFGERMDPERADLWLAIPSQAQTVWLIETRDAATSDTSGSVRGKLTRDFRTMGEFDYGDSHVVVFSQRPDEEVFRARREPAGPSTAAVGIPVLASGLGPRRVAAGDSVYGWEIWHTTDAASPKARLALQPTGSGPTIRSAEAALRPGRGTSDGQAILSQQRLGVPCSAAPGEYDATLELLWQDSSTEKLPLGRLSVVRPPGRSDTGKGGSRLDTQLEGGISMEGFDLTGLPVGPGGTIQAALYWTATKPQDERYSVFVHILDGEGKIVAQHDGIAGGGLCPSTSWGDGEAVRDVHDIHLPETLNPGNFRIIAGLYDPHSGRRVRVLSGEQDQNSKDNVLIASFNIP